MTHEIALPEARARWIAAQGLNTAAPFGSGTPATTRAIEHLGYVQIDTINVIERSHHHILFTRIPDYQRGHLNQAQSLDKSVFEYWTHALAYVPTRDYRFYVRDMKAYARDPGDWLKGVSPTDLRKAIARIRRDGALSIRDIKDDVLVDKIHPWASRKPSKMAMQLGFYSGQLVISERRGMLKKYELRDRHFGWDKAPGAASAGEILDYEIDRALRAQAIVSLNSICHLIPSRKPAILKRLAARKDLREVRVEGDDKNRYWMRDEEKPAASERTHILSPFDPLVIQRARLKDFFNYEHLFEAYIKPEKRRYGYFGLPILHGDRFVAVLDLKTDRDAGKLRMQKWSWLPKSKSPELKRVIEAELDRFAAFQLPKA